MPTRLRLSFPRFSGGSGPGFDPGPIGVCPAAVRTALFLYTGPPVRGWRRANPARRAKSAPTSPFEEWEVHRRPAEQEMTNPDIS